MFGWADSWAGACPRPLPAGRETSVEAEIHRRRRSSRGAARAAGDNIQSLTDLINKSNFYEDDLVNNRFRDVRTTPERDDSVLTLDMRERMFDRFAI